jgi:hypothetical protein
VILLGIGTAYWRDRWGVAHIGLSALVIVGLTWLAVRFEEAPTRVRRLWLAALAIDVLLGIVLHFHLQATMHLAPTAPAALLRGQVLEFSPVATKNMLLQLVLGYRFVGDGGPAAALIVALLALLLIMAARQAVRRLAASSPPNPTPHAPA